MPEPAPDNPPLPRSLVTLRLWAMVALGAHLGLLLLVLAVRRDVGGLLAPLSGATQRVLSFVAAIVSGAAVGTTLAVRTRMPRWLGAIEQIDAAARKYVQTTWAGLLITAGAGSLCIVLYLLGAPNFPAVPLWFVDTICVLILFPSPRRLVLTWTAARRGHLDHQQRRGRSAPRRRRR